MPDAIQRFSVLHRELDLTTGELALHYALDDHHFCERYVFPVCLQRSHIDDEAVERSCRLLHLLAGISYYKAAIPEQIEVQGELLDAMTAAFVTRVYHQGLGEFAHRNDLDVRSRFSLEHCVGSACDIEPSPHRSAGVVVPIGGGKDSLVSVSLLAESGSGFSTISVGQSDLIRDVVETIDRPHFRISRQLDPTLFELNKQGAYNGHVPISAILAAAMLVGSFLMPYNTVIMSNEASAEEGNLTLSDGFVVNHQYSKTLAFEQDFSELVDQTIVTGFHYFSLLRPLSEWAIARRFACLSEYHSVFSSCNRNFRIQGHDGTRWCGHCPKCQFVFLMLATRLLPDALAAIFGGNLLEQAEQIDDFSALMAMDTHKPFECVGEVRESRAAMATLSIDPIWSSALVVRHFKSRLTASDRQIGDLQGLTRPHRLAAEYLPIVQTHDWL